MTKSGAIQTGSFWRHGDGITGNDHSYCYDGFREKDYESGCTVIHIEAEIDIDAIFKDHTVPSTVVDKIKKPDGFYNPATQEDYDTMHDYMKPKNNEAKHND